MLAAIEFDAPDFPWRFTPLDTDHEEHLVPWLTLIVLKADEFERAPTLREPLPSIKVFDAANSLPNLSQSWAWAHVQVTESIDETTDVQELVEELMVNAPQQVISRLVSPRRLDPTTTYHAFVVPAFEVGREAGLGQEPIADGQLPAWSNNTGGLELPVYFEWSFQTAIAGDFESEVRKLKAKTLDARVGTRSMDASAPGYGLQGPSEVLGFEAALKPVARAASPGPDSTFKADLAELLNLPHRYQYPPIAGMAYTVTLRAPGNAAFAELSETVATLLHINRLAASNLVRAAPVNLLRNRPRDMAINAATILRKTGADVTVVEHPIESEFSIVLVEVPQTQHEEVLRVLQSFLGLDRLAAEGLIHQAPVDILAGSARSEAETLAEFLRDAGAEVHLPEPGPSHFPPVDPAERGQPVAPPLYGRWHAALQTVDPDLAHWFSELNLDPRHRAASGLGSDVVRGQQEALMTAAWAQIGDVNEANQKLREAQLAREMSRAMYTKHLTMSDGDELIPLTSRVHARTHNDSGTVRKALQDSSVPNSAVTGTFRRVTRPAGKVARRSGLQQPGKYVSRLNTGEIAGAHPPAEQPARALTIDAVAEGLTPSDDRDRISKAVLTRSAVEQFDPAPDFEIRSLRFPTSGPVVEPRDDTGKASNSAQGAAEGRESGGPSDVTDNDVARFFRRQAATLQERLHVPAINRPIPKSVDLGDVTSRLLAGLDPQRTIPHRVRTQIEGPSQQPLQLEDPLEPIMAAPHFDEPMAEELIRLSQDFLLPGLEHVPNNTIGLLETNPRFVEAFMAGLNHEMARELLWREYPTDQRGSYFRQFWDVETALHYQALAGADEAELDVLRDALRDVPDLHLWNGPLGDHPYRSTAAAEQLVLLIRGDLLRKYPHAAIYAVKATWDSVAHRRELDISSDPKVPVFGGSLPPDVTFLGFDLTEEDALGEEIVEGSEDTQDHGWFFVIEQQVSEPQFGLDVAAEHDETPIHRWEDLTWGHLIPVDQTLQSVSFVDVAQPVPATAQPLWGDSASAMAAILLQTPVRIAVHASVMLSAEGMEIDPAALTESSQTDLT